jgi:adenine-specific DNA-methyltransferase
LFATLEPKLYDAATMLVDTVDFFRLDASRKLDPERRSCLGQFMTPAPTAKLMASMFEARQHELKLLDAGAGVGSLTAAFVSEICSRETKPKSLHVMAYEIDPQLCEYLHDTLTQCEGMCSECGVSFTSVILTRDFIDDGAEMIRGHMFTPLPLFTSAILNPPYRKINSDSDDRLALRAIGVETSNLYTGFLSVALRLLADGGELVSITPRSFCNGLYFKPFRKTLLDTLALRRIHVFESRQIAFREDDVLQENVILHGIKGASREDAITVSSSTGPQDDYVSITKAPPHAIVRPSDPEYYIHIVPDELGAAVAQRLASLRTRLPELGVEVSTGRVVDFRATKFLRENPGADTVPLIYPRHFDNGYIAHPKPGGNKPQALALLPGVEELLVPKGIYALVKRFTSKEETRRVVAALYDPTRIPAERVGFENHINFFHRKGEGLESKLAKGIVAFLNSTLVDLYFRQFSGHTQVNATDLRNLKYPRRSQLEQLGSLIGDEFPSQDEIDCAFEEVLDVAENAPVKNPVQAKKKMGEALQILKAVGLPSDQQNERSVLTFLSLLDLKPNTPWSKADSPLMGIRPMMDWFREYYGKVYAENTRESVRRLTIHQFLDAGIVVINPDDPERPTNSGKTVYQIEPDLLKVLRTFGTNVWEKRIKTYSASVETLKHKYAQQRQMKRIPVEIGNKKVALSPGGQNILVKQVIEEFCSRFTPGGIVAYLGDTGDKFAHIDTDLLASLGLKVEEHGKMPDVVVYHKHKNWLVLVEAVTTHGPVNPKRMGELKKLFAASKAGLVFVTAFLDRKSMLRYLDEISWETEVWVAESPAHMIHFNGERFLGPYPA